MKIVQDKVTSLSAEFSDLAIATCLSAITIRRAALNNCRQSPRISICNYGAMIILTGKLLRKLALGPLYLESEDYFTL